MRLSINLPFDYYPPFQRSKGMEKYSSSFMRGTPMDIQSLGYLRSWCGRYVCG